MEEENVGKYHCVHRDQVLTEGRQRERGMQRYIHTLIYEHICTCDESKDNEYQGILITLHRAKQFIFVRFLYILPLLSKVCLGFLKREQSSY